VVCRKIVHGRFHYLPDCIYTTWDSITFSQMTSKQKNIVLIVAGVAIAFWLPFTRRIILFILPLGTGIDDLVVWVCIIGLAVYGIAKGWIKFEKHKTFQRIDRDKNTKVKQAAWAIIVFVIGLLLAPGLGDNLLYGDPLDVDTIAILSAAAILVIVGWQVISYIDKRNITK
jgi:hypothetical protein